MPCETKKRLSPQRRAFTLVELLVSMAVLSLLLVLTAQMIGQTMSATTASNKVMDTATMSRTVLDRLGRDFSTAKLSGGAAALYYSGSTSTTIDPAKNSTIGFICSSRARYSSTVGVQQDVRGLVVGYKIRDLQVTVAPGLAPNIPLMARGDAAFTFSKAYTGSAQGTNNYGFNIWGMLGVANKYSMPLDLITTNTSQDQSLLNWQGLSDGVLRFHLSFLLDNGKIVQIPPSQNDLTQTPPLKNLQANGDTGACIPVAFSASTSADPNKRYVRGLIAGLVVLDESTLHLAYARDASYTATLATALKRPQNDGETPLSVWQANLPKVAFLPVRQNLRFYQRFCPVNQ